MEEKKIIADSPVEVSGIKIIPVVQVTTHCFSKKKRVSSFCSKKPLFVVIVQKSDINAFNMDGSQVEIEKLIEAMPELEEVI
jgi:uncharacterized spore protein YtfJ